MHKRDSNCSVLLAVCIAVLPLGLQVESASAQGANGFQTAAIISAYSVPPSPALAATSAARQLRISIAPKHKSHDAAIGELFKPIHVSCGPHSIPVDVGNRPDPNEARGICGRSPPNRVDALQ